MDVDDESFECVLSKKSSINHEQTVRVCVLANG